MLMDKEKSWRRNLSTLQSLMEPTVSLDFAQCDVTEGAETQANAKAIEVGTHAASRAEWHDFFIPIAHGTRFARRRARRRHQTLIFFFFNPGRCACRISAEAT